MFSSGVDFLWFKYISNLVDHFASSPHRTGVKVKETGQDRGKCGEAYVSGEGKK